MKNNYLAIGLSCILWALILFADHFGIINFSNDVIIAVVFIFFGLTTFFTALHKINRGTIFTVAVILLSGIILAFIHYFEILDPLDILLSSVLFAAGGGLLILFIDNPKEQVLLYLSFTLFALSFITVLFQKSCIIISYANKVAEVVFGFWSILLIFCGIIFITGRKK